MDPSQQNRQRLREEQHPPRQPQVLAVRPSDVLQRTSGIAGSSAGSLRRPQADNAGHQQLGQPGRAAPQGGRAAPPAAPPWRMHDPGSPYQGHPGRRASFPPEPANAINIARLLNASSLRAPRTPDANVAQALYYTHLAYNATHHLFNDGLSPDMYHIPADPGGRGSRWDMPAPPPNLHSRDGHAAPIGGNNNAGNAAPGLLHPNLAPPPPAGVPPGQLHPSGMVYPVVPTGSFNPDLDTLRPCVDRERAALRLQYDNTLFLPDPTLVGHDNWDKNAIQRVCHAFWPQYRTLLFESAFPAHTRGSDAQHRQQINAFFPALHAHLNWNNGINENLPQMLGEVFPWYHRWLLSYVLTSTVAFRQPTTSDSGTRTDPLSKARTDALHETISTSNAFGDNLEPVPSIFTTVYNQREQTAIHLRRVSEVLWSWIEAAAEHIFTGSYVYVFASWTQAETTSWMRAYGADFNHSARQAAARMLIDAQLASALQKMVSNTHALCVLLAAAHQWPAPGQPSFIFRIYSEERNCVAASDIAALSVEHPADHLRPYTTGGLLTPEGDALGFNARYVTRVREIYSEAFGPNNPEDAPMPPSMWKTQNTLLWNPLAEHADVNRYATNGTAAYPHMVNSRSANGTGSSLPSVITLTTTDGSIHLVRQNGATKAGISVPASKNPFHATSTSSTLEAVMEEFKEMAITWFGGVDISKMLRDYPFFNAETRLYRNVTDDGFDTNGRSNKDFRDKTGAFTASIFLADEYTQFYSYIKSMLPQLGHPDIDSLRRDTQHWYELLVALNASFASIIGWMGRRHLAQTSFVSATHTLIDAEKGHTSSNLPFEYLYQFICIWHFHEGNTFSDILKLENKFVELLPFRDNVLSEQLLENMAKIMEKLYKAPLKAQSAVAFLPGKMVTRAVHVTINIDPECGYYNKPLLMDLQSKLTKLVASGEPLGTKFYPMPAWLLDVRQLLQRGSYVSLQMPEEMTQSSVRITAAATSIPDPPRATTPGPPPASAASPRTYERGRTSGASRSPGRRDDRSPGRRDDTATERRCRDCQMFVQGSWSEHQSKCQPTRQRSDSPGDCRQCNRAHHRCTCNRERRDDRDRSRSQSRDRGSSASRANSMGEDIAQLHDNKANGGRPRGGASPRRGQQGGGRRSIGTPVRNTLCTAMTVLFLASSAAPALASNHSAAHHPLAGLWAAETMTTCMGGILLTGAAALSTTALSAVDHCGTTMTLSSIGAVASNLLPTAQRLATTPIIDNSPSENTLWALATLATCAGLSVVLHIIARLLATQGPRRSRL